MSNFDEFAPPYANLVARASEADRAAFIRRTYLHLAAAIGAFAALEFVLLGPLAPITEPIIQTMVGSRWGWLIVLGMFMGIGWLADRWARSDTSPGMQYAGLGLYVVAEAAIFMPLLYVAAYFSDPYVIPSAGVVTGAVFLGLTVAAFVTGRDFSFLRTALVVGGFVAIGLVLAATLFGFTLGSIFAFAMVVLAGGYILYQTSQIQYHYRTDQHVAAALGLFASVALMFYYVVMIFMRRD